MIAPVEAPRTPPPYVNCSRVVSGPPAQPVNINVMSIALSSVRPAWPCPMLHPLSRSPKVSPLLAPESMFIIPSIASLAVQKHKISNRDRTLSTTSSHAGHAGCPRDTFGMVCNERAISFGKKLPHLPGNPSGYAPRVWRNPYTGVSFYRQVVRRQAR